MAKYEIFGMGPKAGFYKDSELMFVCNNPENANLVLQIMEADSKGTTFDYVKANLSEKLRNIAKEIYAIEEQSESLEESAMEHLADGNELEYTSNHEEYLEAQAKAFGMRSVLNDLDPDILEEDRDEDLDL